MRHAEGTRARHSTTLQKNPQMLPLDPRNPGDAYLQAELDRDRRRERFLLLQTVVAVAVIAVIVVIRQAFFL
jgi:hypothetical protein